MALKLVLIMQALIGSISTDCYQKDMDVGGSKNTCSYMPTIAIIAAIGEEKYDWYEGYFKLVPAEEMAGPEHCQAYCEATPGCKFFAYSAPDPYADCTLKAGYHQTNCAPLYEEMTGSTSGPSQCSSCTKPDMDVGGSFNSCGYMDEVVIYAKPNVNKQTWYNGYYVVMDDVTTWTADVCQGLCASNPLCAYWHMSEDHCYLKADYTDAQKAKDGCTPLYKAFDEERNFNYMSGPSACLHVSETMTCGTMKASYKSGLCCGLPTKRVAKP